MILKPEETELHGRWQIIDGKILPDATCNRIDFLVQKYLTKLKTDCSGWDILYQDPMDKRFWELLYLESDSHGGGPPSLVIIEKEEAKKKYNLENI